MQDKSVQKLFEEQINHYSREDQSTDSLIIPLVLEWLSKKKDKSIEICEFGGGAGQLLNEIQKSNPKILCTNVEIINNYKNLLVSKKIKFVLGSVLSSKLPDNSFDILIMRDVLHHLIGRNYKETIENQRLALNELKRIVRPDGAVFLDELTNTSRIACRLIYFFSRINSKIRIRFISFYVTPNTIVSFLTTDKFSKLCTEIFGQKNMLFKKIARVKTDLKSKLLHFGMPIEKVTFVLKKQLHIMHK